MPAVSDEAEEDPLTRLPTDAHVALHAVGHLHRVAVSPEARAWHLAPAESQAWRSLRHLLCNSTRRAVAESVAVSAARPARVLPANVHVADLNIAAYRRERNG